MKTESVTYEIVAAKINDLLQSSGKLTVRNVLSLTGGSTSKIISYIKRWHDEQQLIAQTAVSDEFLSAIVKEYVKVETRATKFYQNKDSNIEALLMNAMHSITEYEEKLHQAVKVNEELATLKLEVVSLEANLVSLNAKNDIANNTISKLKQKLRDSERKLEEALAKCHQLHVELDIEKAQHKCSILKITALQTKYEPLQIQMNVIN